MKNRIILMVINIALFATMSRCQPNVTNGKLTTGEKQSVVNSISKLLTDNYVFPDVSVKMKNLIKEKLSGSEYESITEPQQFAEQLTTDLRSISHDKHLTVIFNPERVKRFRENAAQTDKPDELEFLNQLRSENFGFRKVERLAGNLGYIDFRNFGPGDYIKEKVASVMEFVEDCDALIFDMRYNGGGDPTGIQVITSYLFGEEPVHLNDLYFRPTDTLEQYWTLKDIKGKRMPDIPVFVLTSSYTFSGAEEFSYNLKNLKRATLVGEVTGGGAHPVKFEIADDNFLISLPVGRAINPITKTNWEGTGVTPDAEISSEKALIKAQILAYEKLKAVGGKRNYDWLIESLAPQLNEVNVSTETLESYSGIYGERKVFYDNGKLMYQRGTRQKFELTPISEDTFMLKDIDFFRLKFLKDASGKVTELIGMMDDGSTDSSPRTGN